MKHLFQNTPRRQARRILALLVLLGAAGSGCRPALPERAEAPETASADASARWWKGNLHTHSLWSDGDDYPEMIIDWYRQQGYHFVALSDHNTLAEGEKWVTVGDGPGPRAAYRRYLDRFGDEWVDQQEADDTLKVRLKTLAEYRPRFEAPGAFLILQSEEISDTAEKKPVHINATNLREHIAPQRGRTVLEVMQRNVDAVLAQRARTGTPMFPHINHPNFGWAVTTEDLIALQGERFFEVYNGHPRVHNTGDDLRPGTERMWDIILAQRLARGDEVMYGLAVDDAHHYHAFDSTRSNPGRGWVMVRARALTPEALIEAMEAGDFYATSGVTLEDLRADEEQIALRIAPEAGVTYTTRFIGTRRDFDAASTPVPTPEGERPIRRYSDEIGVVLAEVEGTAPVYRLQGDELYVRAKVFSSRQKANSTHPDEREAAWTQPFVPGRD